MTAVRLSSLKEASVISSPGHRFVTKRSKVIIAIVFAILSTLFFSPLVQYRKETTAVLEDQFCNRFDFCTLKLGSLEKVSRKVSLSITEKTLNPLQIITMDKNVHTVPLFNRGMDTYLGTDSKESSQPLSRAVRLAAQKIRFSSDSVDRDNVVKSVLLKLEKSLEMISKDSIDFQIWDQESPLLIKTGYKEHTILVGVKPKKNNTYEISLYNTGSGVAKHPRWLKTYKFMTHLTVDQVPAKDALNEESLRKMKSFSKTEETVNATYELFSNWTINGIKWPDSSYEQDYESIQMEGTCSAQALMAFIRDFSMKSSSGSAWDRLGLYKEIKARIMVELIPEDLKSYTGGESMLVKAALAHGSTVSYYVRSNIKKMQTLFQIKKQKYQRDLELLKIAQDVSVYNENIELIRPWLDEKTFQEMQGAGTVHERLAMLLVALNTIADREVEHVPVGQGVLFDVMKARSDLVRESKEFVFEVLNSYLKEDLDLLLKSIKQMQSYTGNIFLKTLFHEWKASLDPISKKQLEDAPHIVEFFKGLVKSITLLQLSKGRTKGIFQLNKIESPLLQGMEVAISTYDDNTDSLTYDIEVKGPPEATLLLKNSVIALKKWLNDPKERFDFQIHEITLSETNHS